MQREQQLRAGSAVSIEPLNPVIGAEINGLDLRQPLSDEDVASIQGALNEHQVVFFNAP